MANWASVAYAIEGPNEVLEKIKKAIMDAIIDKSDFYEEYKALVNLGYSTLGLDECFLGGNITDEPDLNDGVLRFWSEERWGLQNFNVLLEKLFPEIKVYWVVEESGCEVYCTNDKEGKYFPDRYWVDTCVDDNYQSEYFRDEESMYKWLSKLTEGRVTNLDQVNAFNSDYEDSDAGEENFIYIHEFQVMD